MTREEAIRAMLDGKKVRATDDVNEEFFLFFDGTGFIDNEGDFYKFNENSAAEWETHEDPKPKVKKWQWVARYPCTTGKYTYFITRSFSKNKSEAAMGLDKSVEVLHPADWTEIEVEES